MGGLTYMDRINWSKYKREYVYKEKENYLFKPQLDKLVNLVAEISEDNDTHANKVIGINGERGSGKSSLLHTFKHYIENYDSEKNARYYVLKPIDPNYLDSKMGLLEMVLTYLYDAVDEKLKDQREKGYDVTTAKQLRDDIIKQIAFQANLRQDETFRDRSVPSDLINEFRNRINFSEAYNQLFKRCWALLKEKSCENYQPGNMIILIDDIDIVDNGIIYQMLEDIKRVLGKNITTVLTYRKIQLYNSLYEVKIQENKNLINNFSMMDRHEVIKQGDTFLEKLLVKNYVVEMEDGELLIKKCFSELFNSEKEKEFFIQKGFVMKDSIIKNIYNIIERKLLIDIEGRDYLERERFEANFTLRSIMQLLEITVSDFKEIKRTVNFKSIDLDYNLRGFKDYIINEAPRLIDSKEEKILLNWIKADISNKNYILYREILKLTSKTNHLLNVSDIQPYNICLGDIIEILQQGNISSEMKYLVKILYSIELLLSLINGIYNVTAEGVSLRGVSLHMNNSNDNNIYFKYEDGNVENAFWNTDYYKLTRYKIVPDAFFKNIDNGEILTTFKYTDIREDNLEAYRALDKVLYTTISTQGDIVKKARPRGNKLEQDSKMNYKYRYYFTPQFHNGTKIMDTDFVEQEIQKVALASNTSYFYDPFTGLVKEQYLHQLTIGSTAYLFYSLFDLETIIRSTVDSQKNSASKGNLNIEHLKSVNRIINRLHGNNNRLGRVLLEGKDVQVYTKDEISILSGEFNFNQLSFDLTP